MRTVLLTDQLHEEIVKTVVVYMGYKYRSVTVAFLVHDRIHSDH